MQVVELQLIGKCETIQVKPSKKDCESEDEAGSKTSIWESTTAPGGGRILCGVPEASVGQQGQKQKRQVEDRAKESEVKLVCQAALYLSIIIYNHNDLLRLTVAHLLTGLLLQAYNESESGNVVSIFNQVERTQSFTKMTETVGR